MVRLAPHPLRRDLRSERGQALVEFAVVLPLLLAITLGILYFGRYESYSSQMTQLAEQGARDAAVNFSVPSGTTANGKSCTATTTTSPNNGNLACFIASQASGELASGNGTTVQAVSVWADCNSNVTGGASACTVGNNVTVCLRAPVAFPGLQGVSAGTIFQSATMRIEQAGAQDTSLTESASNSPSSTEAGSSLPSGAPC